MPYLAAFVLLCLALASHADPVPPPAATPVDLVVSGRTSTLRSIVVADCGQTIPDTFSGSRPHNPPGFKWFVSRHFALQTDYPEAHARYLLTVLELAFPHYRELFGRDLPDLDHKRLATVYAKSKESLAKAMQAWGIGGFQAGGITVYGTGATFNWPSGTLEYHQRYIMIHEAVHQYQMILHGDTCPDPMWIKEGIADFVSHHVWESAAQRLTVEVLDKATINNFYDTALTAAAAPGANWTATRLATMAVNGRAPGFLLTAFLATDPDRLQKLRIYLGELIRSDDAALTRDRCFKLLADCYGGADKLDADFAAWLAARHSSFHYVDWGWEQDGETLRSYGFPQKGKYAQTDLRFAPGDKPSFDPLVMDYPALLKIPSTVGPVSRGADEPSVGATVAFLAAPAKGEAGLGLGVEGVSHLRVLLSAAKKLILDGSDLGAPRVEFDLPESLTHGSAFGLTVKLAKAQVEATVRAEAADGMQTFTAALPITPAQRQRLLTDPMAALSVGSRHAITPWLDVPRAAEPDLMLTTPPNRWRSRADRELECVHRALWRAGDKAPDALRALGVTLRDTQRPEAFYQGRAAMAAQLPAAAAAELYGLTLTLGPSPKSDHRVELTTVVEQSLAQTASGKLRISLLPLDSDAPTQVEEDALSWTAEGSRPFVTTFAHPPEWRGLRARAEVEAVVDGRPVTVRLERRVMRPAAGW